MEKRSLRRHKYPWPTQDVAGVPAAPGHNHCPQADGRLGYWMLLRGLRRVRTSRMRWVRPALAQVQRQLYHEPGPLNLFPHPEHASQQHPPYVSSVLLGE